MSTGRACRCGEQTGRALTVGAGVKSLVEWSRGAAALRRRVAWRSRRTSTGRACRCGGRSGWARASAEGCSTTWEQLREGGGRRAGRGGRVQRENVQVNRLLGRPDRRALSGHQQPCSASPGVPPFLPARAEPYCPGPRAQCSLKCLRCVAPCGPDRRWTLCCAGWRPTTRRASPWAAPSTTTRAGTPRWAAACRRGRDTPRWGWGRDPDSGT